MKIDGILEKADLLVYLEKRNLATQYQKAKDYLLAGHLRQVNFKIRQPKEEDVYSFRINKQFRAFCICEENTLIVFKIDNHQN